MATEAQKRATLKYDATHTIQYHLKLNLETDADIMEAFSRQESVQGYIKRLVRDDIARIGCQNGCQFKKTPAGTPEE